MTEEEAREEIIDMANALQLIPNTPKGKAVSMALKALEQEPCDAISREKAMNIVSDYYNMRNITRHEEDILYEIMDKIENLPSVYPQPKTGHWIESKDERGCIKLTCSCCGYGSAINSGGNFCRDCGAKMVEPQESEDKDDRDT